MRCDLLQPTYGNLAATHSGTFVMQRANDYSICDSAGHTEARARGVFAYKIYLHTLVALQRHSQSLFGLECNRSNVGSLRAIKVNQFRLFDSKWVPNICFSQD